MPVRLLAEGLKFTWKLDLEHLARTANQRLYLVQFRRGFAVNDTRTFYKALWKRVKSGTQQFNKASAG